MLQLRISFLKFGSLGLLLGLSAPAFTFAQTQTTFTTYEGRLFDQQGKPSQDRVSFTFQVLNANPTGNPSQDCILYEERQPNVDLGVTKGSFSLQIGSLQGSSKRTANDPNFSMPEIFKNTGTLSVPTPVCASGIHSPALGSERRLRVKVQNISSGVTETLAPDLIISSTPQAMVADTLQGLLPSDFVRSTGLTGPLRFNGSTTGFVNLRAPASPTNISLTLPADAGTSGQVLTTDGTGVLSWSTPSGGGGGGGGISSVATTPPLSVTGTSALTLSLPQSNGTTNGYLASSDWTSFDGKVAGKANLTNVNALIRVQSSGSVTETQGLSVSGSPNITQLNVQSGTSQASNSLQIWKDVGGATLFSISPSASPVATTDLTNKAYVDTQVSSSIAAISGFVKSDGSVALSGPWTTGQAITLPSNGLTVGTTDLVVSAGNVGVGTASPGSKLDIAGDLRLRGATSGYIGLRAPAAVGTPVTLTLPNGDGTNGQVLTTNGGGQLQWTTVNMGNYFDAGSSTSINWAQGNVQQTSAAPGSLTFSNMLEGTSYTLSATSSTSGTFNFSHAGLTFRFSPLNGPTEASTVTIYNMYRMGNIVYVSWASGF
ncbi:MAG: hypothetical protein K2X47_04255 [Bdellovibrionales bacterium]|nr:hypothetical protein [Bdellovibrionales bacterium]